MHATTFLHPKSCQTEQQKEAEAKEGKPDTNQAQKKRLRREFE
jgi:hypothetical protein